MKVVSDSLLPPVGPSPAPTTWTNSQGIAPGSTETEAIAMPQTLLVSSEACQVTRELPFSNGLGLRKWVMICASCASNKVAWGPNNVQAKPELAGRQT